MSEQEIDALRERWEADRSPALTLELAGEYRQQNDRERALAVLAGGLEAHPEHVAARVAKGRCHLELNQLEEASRELKRVVFDDPAHLMANRLLAEAHLRLGELGRARDRLDLFELLGGEGPEVEELEDRLAAAAAGPGPEASLAETAAVELPTEPPTPEAEPVESPTEPAMPEALLVDSPTEPAIPEAEPVESPAEPAISEVETVEAVSEPPAAAVEQIEVPPAEPGSDPDPFVLLDWVEFDESKYAAALFGGGIFAPPGGGSAAAREPSGPAPGAEPTAAAEEPEPTLTLAELYLKQGHREEAAGILRQILERHPGNAGAARALAELEKGVSWPLSADDLLGGAEAAKPAGEAGSAVELLRRYRERLRGKD